MSTESLLALSSAEDPRVRRGPAVGGRVHRQLQVPGEAPAYQRVLHCWFAFCAVHDLHPFKGVRRTHLEIYLRQMECLDAAPSNATLYRRIATLSSWFAWLEDEDVNAGNAAAHGCAAPSAHGPAAVVDAQRTHRPGRRRRG